MIDIVGPKTGAHQLLEQVRLFVRALGGAESGQRLDALLITDFDETLGRDIERFFP